MPQPLLAEISFRRGETVVETPQAGKAKSPIEMIGLHSVRLALNVEHFLIGFDRVRHFIVSRGEIVVPPRRRIHSSSRSAEASPDIQPAVDLNRAVLPSVAVGPGPERRHQWPCLCPGLSYRYCASYRPRGKRKWRSLNWGGIATECLRALALEELAPGPAAKGFQSSAYPLMSRRKKLP